MTSHLLYSKCTTNHFIIFGSDGLKEHLSGKDEQKTISYYLLLCGGLNSSDNIIDRLQPVEAVHLKSFATETATYWYDLLNEKYSR